MCIITNKKEASSRLVESFVRRTLHDERIPAGFGVDMVLGRRAWALPLVRSSILEVPALCPVALPHPPSPSHRSSPLLSLRKISQTSSTLLLSNPSMNTMAHQQQEDSHTVVVVLRCAEVKRTARSVTTKGTSNGEGRRQTRCCTTNALLSTIYTSETRFRVSRNAFQKPSLYPKRHHLLKT